MHLQVKVCEWRKNDTFDDYVSVGKRAVVECVVCESIDQLVFDSQNQRDT